MSEQQLGERHPQLGDIVIAAERAGVTFGSPAGPVVAFSDVWLSARNAEFISIVGPSGCGKTTLLRSVAGLIGLTDGSVSVLGREVKEPTGLVGLVFQRPVLMPWRTVIRNVLLPADMGRRRDASAREQARDLLELTGLAGFEDYYPYQLSGGMQQRVALCRALMQDPDVLLMDEPFGALDALSREHMNLELQRIWLEKSKTVIFITHSISEAVFLSDRVLVMSQRPGTIVGEVAVAAARPRRLADLTSPELSAAIVEVRAMMAGESGRPTIE